MYRYNYQNFSFNIAKQAPLLFYVYQFQFLSYDANKQSPLAAVQCVYTRLLNEY